MNIKIYDKYRTIHIIQLIIVIDYLEECRTGILLVVYARSGI